MEAAGKPQPEGTPEWKKLLEMKAVDAVVSALPCDLHAANYLEVLAAGKDLYGEKPMCLTPSDCDKVVSAANKSKQVVQIGLISAVPIRGSSKRCAVPPVRLANRSKGASSGRIRGDRCWVGSAVASVPAIGSSNRPFTTGT